MSANRSASLISPIYFLKLLLQHPQTAVELGAPTTDVRLAIYLAQAPAQVPAIAVLEHFSND
jgi:hypothetical protein